MGNLTLTSAATRAGQVPFADCEISEEAQAAALDVLRSGWVTTGRQTLAFEDEFAAHVGSQHAVAVSSCTAAIELSLRSLGLAPGSAVLTSTLTFCGAVQAILHAGLWPVLVDVDPDTGMPDAATTRAAVEACGGAAAMVVVHWAGDPADVEELAEAAGLPTDRVVEDAAHAVGTSVRNRAGSLRPVGSGTAATCFSFYATKNLPLGEGGMVTTDDPERATWIRRSRLHGMSADAWGRYLPGGSWRYDVTQPGLKANLTDLQAAIGRAQLAHLSRWQHRRAQIASRYDRRLADLQGVRLPHRPEPGAGVHAWHLYPVRITPSARLDRDQVVAELGAQGIGTSVHFIPIHELAYFRRLGVGADSPKPGADALFPTLLSLPMYPRLSDDQVDQVCDALHRAAGTNTHRDTEAPSWSN